MSNQNGSSAASNGHVPAGVNPSGISIVDWDLLFEAVETRLSAISNGTFDDRHTVARCDTSVSAQDAIAECVTALRQLHQMLADERQQNLALKNELLESDAALSRACAELFAATAKERVAEEKSSSNGSQAPLAISGHFLLTLRDEFQRGCASFSNKSNTIGRRRTAARTQTQSCFTTEKTMHLINRWVAPIVASTLLYLGGAAQAASHREAPLIAQDPTADITDVYLFRSWNNPGNVVLIMNVIPTQEPSSGPNYFNFADDVVYAFHFDLNADGKADDVNIEVRFKTEIRGVVQALGLPLSYVALPPITALDGAGSEGLGLRQSYTVSRVQGNNRTNLGAGTMFAVPSRVGPRTMPNYEALAAQGIYGLSGGGRVFAGQRDETFYIDLGAAFDTLNLRRTPPILTAAEDGNDAVNPFGNDMLSGFNVSTIAIELPIAALTSNPAAVIGMYASTSRQKVRVLRGGDKETVNSGPSTQVARMANPLVNELIIGTPVKDLWNATDPEDEAQFLDFYLNSRLATAMNIVFGTGFPTTNRTDLVNVLLKYSSQAQSGACSAAGDCSELLRLNLAVPPTAPAAQKRLSVLAGDPAGWPNGRRPNDDVTDIALRVVAGALRGPVPALGDGVNFNIGAVGSNVTAGGIYTLFPFLPTPHDGRNRRHIDCGEPLANPCN